MKAYRTLGVAIICVLFFLLPCSPVISDLIHLDDETTGEYTFTLTFPKFSTETLTTPDHTTYLRFLPVDGYDMTLEPGRPQLPTQSVFIGIPTDANDIEITVLDVVETTTTIPYPLYPTPPDQSELTTIPYIVDTGFYSSNNAYYPEDTVQQTSRGSIREIGFIRLMVYPVKYNPGESCLLLTETITIQITWVVPGGNRHDLQTPESFEPLIDSIHLQGYVENNEWWYDPPTPGQVSYPTNLASTSNKADYLIITANAFYTGAAHQSIRNLADHRANQSYYDVAVVNLSKIYSTVGSSIPFNTLLNDTGDARDLKIKTFIRYVYDNWDNASHALQYVLLIGDAYPDTASYYLPLHLSTIIRFSEFLMTDHWYSCINDDDGNGYVNDTDITADVFIGRFSVQTTQQLTNIVQKIIHYEDEPPQNPDEDWGSQALLLNGFDGVEGNSMPQLRDNAVLPYLKETNEVYAGEYNGDYAQAKAEFLSYLNAGVAVYAFSAHGCPDHHWIGSEDVHQFFRVSDLANLNNGDRLPVVYACSCGITEIFNRTGPCLGEAFVYQQNKGAIAFFGPLQASSVSDVEGSLEAELRALFSGHNHILGRSIVQGKLNYIPGYWRNVLEYNLIGDPALDLTRTLNESYKPDFSCMILGYEQTDDELTISARLNNTGAVDAEDIDVELYNQHPDNGVRIDDGLRRLSLQKGKSILVNITIPLQPGWISGYSTALYLTMDHHDRIDELSEHNNMAHNLSITIDTTIPLVRYLATGDDVSISENKIVYADIRYGNTDIYLYDLGADNVYNTSDDRGEYRITSLPSIQSTPIISGNKIVWKDSRNGNEDIYLYDLGADGVFNTTDDMFGTAEFRLCTDPSAQRQPWISGNRIVWRDERNGNADIYLYDIGPDGVCNTSDDIANRQITTDPYNQVAPSLSGNMIVWQDNRNGNDDIYIYDVNGGGEQRITTDIYTQNSPVISGKKIVWQDNRYGTFDVFMYNLNTSTETRITNAPGTQINPLISGNTIVWEDWRNNNADIYLYDLGPDGQFGTLDDQGEKQLTDNTTQQTIPAVDGNTVVYINRYLALNTVYLVELNLHTRHLNNYPFSLATVNTGSAAMKTVLEYCLWDSVAYPQGPTTLYNESDLFTRYRGSDATLNASELAAGLNAEIDDPGHGWMYGYFFSPSASTQVNAALKDIAIWLDYVLSADNEHRIVPVPIPGHVHHVPVIVPFDGDYSHWVTIQGIFSNRSAWRAGHDINAVMIYGFWVADPQPGGLGGNTYVTAQRFIDVYFKPLQVPGDYYNSKYVVLIDPPENVPDHENDGTATVGVTPSLFTPADSRLIQHTLKKPQSVTKISARTILATTAMKAFNSVASHDVGLTAALDGATVKTLAYNQHECTVIFTTQHHGDITVILDTMTGCLYEIRLSSTT